MIDDAAIKLRHAALDPVLDKRGRRRFGGVTAIARITGIACSTIDLGWRSCVTKARHLQQPWHRLRVDPLD